jgi:hypothetical protein
MRERMQRLGEIWCGVMHDEPMWPVHNHYECRRCGRRYRVAWTPAVAMRPARPARAESAPVVDWRGHAA